MSRRWAKRQTYAEIDQAALYRAHYGEDRRRRDLADMTVVTPIEPSEWQEALRAAVLALGGALLVILAWVALRTAMGVP